MASIKKSLEYILSKIGLFLISKWNVDGFLLSQRLKRIISEYNIDCFIDVGANVEQYHDFLRNRVKVKGIIISFEPDPDNFMTL